MSRPGVVTSGPGPWIAAFVPAFVLSGGVLVHLRPQNPIGWILLVSGLFQVTNLAADSYATRALTDPDDSLPLGLPMAWLASWTWPPSLLLPMLVLPALYPTGRPSSSYWRWHVRASLVGIVLAALAMASGPGGLDDTVAGTRLPWTAPVWTSYVLGLSAAVLLIAAAASSIVGTFVRAWRAATPERQQLLWLVCVVAVLVATIVRPPRRSVRAVLPLIPVAVASVCCATGCSGSRSSCVGHCCTSRWPSGRAHRRRADHRTGTAGPRGPAATARGLGRGGWSWCPVAGRLRRAGRPAGAGRASRSAGRSSTGSVQVSRSPHDDPVASMLEAVAVSRRRVVRRGAGRTGRAAGCRWVAPESRVYGCRCVHGGRGPGGARGRGRAVGESHVRAASRGWCSRWRPTWPWS